MSKELVTYGTVTIDPFKTQQHTLNTPTAFKTALDQNSLSLTPANNYLYGCVYIKQGTEDSVSELLRNVYKFDVISPVFLRYHRKNGMRTLKQFDLLPDYLFFRVERTVLEHEEVEKKDLIHTINSFSGVHSVLTYEKDNWVLMGNDRQMAETLFDMNGIVGPSKSRLVDGKIRVIDGFLAPYEHRIKKIDKRHNTAMVEIEFAGRMRTMWLGYELVA